MMRLGAADTREATGRVPRPRTSFVGRERELGSARRLLDCARLLTLTGPGGTGKTRLSIALAARVEAEFRDGVRFVPLAAVRDPSLVPALIAQGIGLQDARGQSLLEHISSYLADREVLLILDNFEHVLPASGTGRPGDGSGRDDVGEAGVPQGHVLGGQHDRHQRAQPVCRRPTAAFSIVGSSSSTAFAAGPSGTKLSSLVTRVTRPA
jgi:hypothetical protein